jgi:hypothetical protein
LAFDHVHAALGYSERRACYVLDQHRSTQRKPKIVRDDEVALRADIIRLASEYGRGACPGPDQEAIAGLRLCFGAKVGM